MEMRGRKRDIRTRDKGREKCRRCGGGGILVRSDVQSGRNGSWEWRLDAGDPEDRTTRSDAYGHGARASDAGLTFADVKVIGAGSAGSPVFS